MEIGEILEQGQKHQQAGRQNDARKCYQAILTQDPKNAMAAHCMGVAFQTEEAWDQAIEYFTQALDASAGHVPSLLARAECLRAHGKSNAAICDYEQILSLQPEHDVALTNLGISYLVTTKPKKAIPLFERALEINPANDSARLNLASALRLDRRYDDAIRLLNDAIKKAPQDASAHYMLGAALFESGQKRHALGALQDSLKLNPFDRRPMAALSVLLPELGMYDEAAAFIDYQHLLCAEPVQTPVGFSSVAEFNQALAAHIKGHPTLEYERSANTTKGGWHSGNMLDDNPGPCAAMETLVNQRFHEYFVHLPKSNGNPYRAWQPEAWRLSMWGVVLDSSGYQDPHIHSDAWLSGVYYVQVPDIIANNNEGAGYLEFGRGKAEFACADETLTRLVQPVAGLMVQFPSFYYHRTIPFESDQQRICVAFDMRPIVQQG